VLYINLNSSKKNGGNSRTPMQELSAGLLSSGVTTLSCPVNQATTLLTKIF